MMTAKPDDIRKADGRDRKGLKPLELFATIKSEIEQRRRAAEWQAEIPTEWTARVEERVAREIKDWQADISGAVKPDAASAASRIVSGLVTFAARLEGPYQSLMEAIFPAVAMPVTAGAIRGGTRSGTAVSGLRGDPTAEQDPSIASLTPDQASLLDTLPAWIVVPIGIALEPGTEFAILPRDADKAEANPTLQLRVDGSAATSHIAFVSKNAELPGAPGGRATRIRLAQPPKSFTISEHEDGTLVIDFIMT